MDSRFQWTILLRAYTRFTRDSFLAEVSICQGGLKRILSLCLSEGLDTFPTLLCADGCCMIDCLMVILYFYLKITNRLHNLWMKSLHDFINE